MDCFRQQRGVAPTSPRRPARIHLYSGRSAAERGWRGAARRSASVTRRAQRHRMYRVTSTTAAATSWFRVSKSWMSPSSCMPSRRRTGAKLLLEAIRVSCAEDCTGPQAFNSTGRVGRCGCRFSLAKTVSKLVAVRHIMNDVAAQACDDHQRIFVFGRCIDVCTACSAIRRGRS